MLNALRLALLDILQHLVQEKQAVVCNELLLSQWVRDEAVVPLQFRLYPLHSVWIRFDVAATLRRHCLDSPELVSVSGHQSVAVRSIHMQEKLGEFRFRARLSISIAISCISSVPEQIEKLRLFILGLIHVDYFLELS